MQTVSLLPCAVSSLIWARKRGGQQATVIVKQTHRLAPGFPLADPQEPIYDETRGTELPVDRPSDLVPFKNRVDCVLLSSSAAPADHEAPATGAREVEALLRLADGSRTHLRIEAPGAFRRAALGSKHPLGRMLTQGPPSGSPGEQDPSSFQCAPAEQQVDELRPGDLLELRHLPPHGLTLILALPLSPPAALLFDDGPEPRRLELRNDTIVVDSARTVLTVTSRASFALNRDDVLVVIGNADVTASPGELLDSIDGDAASWLRDWISRRAASPEPLVPRPNRSTRRMGEPRRGEPVWLAPSAPRSTGPSHAVPQSAWAGSAAPLAEPEQQATMVLEVPPFAVEPAMPLQGPPAPAPAPPAPLSSRFAPEPPQAAMPSYLKGQPAPFSVQHVVAGHDCAAALAGVVAASNAAVERYSTPPAQGPAPSSPASASTDHHLLDVLFVDERGLKEADAVAALDAIASPRPVRPPPEDASSWASPAPRLDLRTRVHEALLAGRDTPLQRVGFRPQRAGQPAVLQADIMRVSGVFAPKLSIVELLRTMLRVASLAIPDGAKAAELTALLPAIGDDLEYAPDSALSPVRERLERACDGADGRPTLDEVRALAEATVLAKGGYSRSVLRGGTHVRGTLHAGTASIPLYIADAFEKTLPNQARWHAIALVRPAVSQDTREPGQMVLAALAIGRLVDPINLVCRPIDEASA